MLEVGDSIAGFALVELVGQGGSGSVFRAERDGQTFAIKIPRSRHDSSEAEARFLREAELLCGFRHPHLVRGVECGEENGVLYSVLEFIEGELVQPIAPEISQKSLTRNSQALQKLVERVEQVALALDYLHQGGVIHRDVKPDNILLDEEGTVRLLDLGIAKILDERTMTFEGELVGTLNYVSPEQAMGGRVPVDERTDVYSLGVTLYWLLTSELPFEGEDAEQLLHRILLGDYIPPRKRASWIPRDLANIVETCLQLDPENRYVSARELAEDLQRFRNHQAVYAKSIPRHRRMIRRARRRAVPILFIFVVVFAGIQWKRSEDRLRQDWIEVSFVELEDRDLELTIDLYPGEEQETPGFSRMRVKSGQSIRLPPYRRLEIFARSGDEVRTFGTIVFPSSAGLDLPLAWSPQLPGDLEFHSIPGTRLSVLSRALRIQDVIALLEGPWEREGLFTGDLSARIRVQAMLNDPAETPARAGLNAGLLIAATLGARLVTDEEYRELAEVIWDESIPLEPGLRAELQQLQSKPTHIFLISAPRSLLEGVAETLPTTHQRIYHEDKVGTGHHPYQESLTTNLILVR